MLKKISNLQGVKNLNKTEQKAVAGEGSRMPISCNSDFDCEQSGVFCPGQSRCVPGFGICLGVGPGGGGC